MVPSAKSPFYVNCFYSIQDSSVQPVP